MDDSKTPADATAGPEPVAEASNVGFDDFLAARTERYTPPVEETVEEEPAQAEQTTDAVEQPADNEGPAQTSQLDDVLSQLENLSPEEFEAATKGLSSRAVDRFGALTRRSKEAEEEAARLRVELAKQQNPLETEEQIEHNPFDSLATIDELQSKVTEFKNLEDWAFDLLDDNEDARLDDVITEVNGESKTKREIKKALREARTAREKFLPARARDIQQVQFASQQAETLRTQMGTELSWYSDEGSDLRKQYDAALADPSIVALKEAAPPQLRGRIDYMIAHAANSINLQRNPAKPEVTADAVKAIRPTPPSAPVANSKTSLDRRDTQVGKALAELENSYRTNPNKSSHMALRTAQIQAQMSNQ